MEARGPAELGRALGAGLDITIVGDNDFYSQQDQARFFSSPIPRALTTTTKNGLLPVTCKAQEPQPARLARLSRRNTTLQPNRGRTRRRGQDGSRLLRSAHYVPRHRSSRPSRPDRTRPARERLRAASRPQRRAIRALPCTGQGRLRLRRVRRRVREPVLHPFQPGSVAAAHG